MEDKCLTVAVLSGKGGAGKHWYPSTWLVPHKRQHISIVMWKNPMVIFFKT
jgi:MinD superfamily P-loop ATPase